MKSEKQIKELLEFVNLCLEKSRNPKMMLLEIKRTLEWVLE